MGPKKKQEKMSLGTFLGDQSLGSWADEMDDMPMPASTDSRSGYGGGSGGRDFGSRSGMGGDREREYTDRGFSVRDALPMPSKPPYTAHLGNLSFDVTSGDIEGFFAACAVTSVRIVEDKLERKPKGFGYVEFGTLEGLKKALELNGTQFQGRNVRISVAEPPKDRQESRELNDWTRKGPLPELATTQRRPSDRGSFRQYDAASDAGSERQSSRRGAPSFEQGDGKPRDFGNWERKGPLSPSLQAPAGPGREERGIRRNDRSFDQRTGPSWGEGRAEDGPRSSQREFTERPVVERTPTAADMDNQWRSRMQPDAPQKSTPATPDVSTPSSPVAAPVPAVPASRPRLNLAKRTISEAPAADQSATAGSDAKASPFGAARPIDTTAREKEIESKREAARQKKEEDDKALAEKRAAEKAEREKTERAEKAERAPRPDKVTSPSPQENGKPARKESSTGGENGASALAPGKNYEILRRVTEQDSGVVPELENETGEDSANGTIVEDKSVKPQEIVRDIDSSKNEPQTTAEEMEEEGWATVERPSRKGRGGARAALAS